MTSRLPLLLMPALLAACATRTPTQFHTLLEPGAAAPALTSGLRFRIESPVRVPPQVDRPQLVLRRADGSLQVLEQQRWVAPLADEWRDAIAGALSQRLGALDVSRIAAPPGPAPYRVQLELQRFDSQPGAEVAQQALWSVALPGQAAPALTCQSAVTESAGADAAAVAAAQRRATQRVASAVAGAISALQQGRPPACP